MSAPFAFALGAIFALVVAAALMFIVAVVADATEGNDPDRD